MIDIVERALPYLIVLGALAVSLALIRWIDRKGTMKFQALGVLLFVILTAIGWGLISNLSSFLELRAILGLLVPAGVISAYLKLRHRIDLTPRTTPPMRWEIELYAHAARSANCFGESLPSELCGLSSL